MGSINWVASAGGPLIVVPVEIAHHWRGDEVAWPLSGGLEMIWAAVRRDSDYGRACEIEGNLGMLEVGPGSCLILGDDPMQTTIIPSDGGGLIVRWFHAESEDDVLHAVQSVPEDAWESTTIKIQIGLGGLLVFDSAYPGDGLPVSPSEDGSVSWLGVAFARGNYEIDTIDYEPNDQTRLILHRLRRV